MNPLELIKKLQEDAFFISKDLIKEQGVEYAIIYGLLSQRQQYEGDEFIAKICDISKETGISQKKVRTILQLMESRGIISKKLKGLPAQPFIKILQKD